MTLTVTASHGVTFTVRIVRKGERYGLDGVLVYDEDEPMVEFYDTRYPHTPWGQFVSRYYVSDLLEDPPTDGLDLDGGIPAWEIDGPAMLTVLEWLTEQTKAAAEVAEQIADDETAYDWWATRE